MSIQKAITLASFSTSHPKGLEKDNTTMHLYKVINNTVLPSLKNNSLFININKINNGSVQRIIHIMFGFGNLVQSKSEKDFLPLIGYNSRTPPISSPRPNNLRIIMCRRPIEERYQLLNNILMVVILIMQNIQQL